jgi:hypothetical protein
MSARVDRLGIELLSMSGMNPLEHVGLAADLGCGPISTGPTPFPVNPHGYAQLCDAPLSAEQPDYMREATFARRVPGEGDLPLAAFIAALPTGIAIGLEVPMLAKAEAGVSPRDRLAPAVAAAKHVIGQGEGSC